MTRSRPKALVTAAVSGPGLDLLHQLADLVLDSWLDQPTLRIYNATQLAERVAAEGASIVIVESDICGAELYEQPIIAVCSCRGDPTNVDVPAATAAGVPVLRAPGPQRGRGGRARRRPPLRRHPGHRPGRPRRAGGRDLPRRQDPLPALPGLGAGRQDGRAWSGSARSGAPCAGACAGLGMEVLAYDPYAPDATSSLDELLGARGRHLDPRAGDRGDDGHDRRRRLRQDARRRRLPEHGAGQDPRHRRARRRAGVGQGRRGRASTTSRASTWRRTTR